jgi:hypothetical protein
MENILIVGNGFDLAHGLPTRYIDFLRYCKEYEKYKEYLYKVDPGESYTPPDMNDFLNTNIWLRYFLSITPYLNVDNTWIDFENEIVKVVALLEESDFKVQCLGCPSSAFDFTEDAFVIEGDKACLEDIQPFWDCFSGYRVYDVPCIGASITKEEFSEYLYRELCSFAKMFEHYCFDVIDSASIEHMVYHGDSYAPWSLFERGGYSRHEEKWSAITEWKCSGNNPKLKSIGLDDSMQSKNEIYSSKKNIMERPEIKNHRRFDAILSFNYTHTFMLRYGVFGLKYCYIHGEVQADNETNLIFGIDDKLEGDRANSDFSFAKFKKYFQRVMYKTGSEYKDWLKDMSDECTVYIVGHSLGETDHDILREFFDAKCKIVICYHSELDHIDKIQKVISIIGKDELIERVHGSNPLIKFVDQFSEDGVFEYCCDSNQ